VFAGTAFVGEGLELPGDLERGPASAGLAACFAGGGVCGGRAGGGSGVLRSAGVRGG
jgi:hypothetical protein